MAPDIQERGQAYLKKAERLTKTDLSYVISGGFWLTVGQISLGVISFALSIAFAHFVPKDVYGTYRFLISLFWTLTAFSLTGLPTALSQAIARGFEGAYIKSFVISMKWGMSIFFISVGTSIYYFLYGNSLLGYGLLLIAFIGPFMQTSLLYGAFLEGKKDFKGMALYGIVLNAVPALLAFAAMFITANPLAFLAAYIAGNVGTGLFLCWVTYRRYKPRGESNPELFRLSGHFSLMNILATVANQIDKLLVFHFLGAIQLAVYSFAIALPEQAKTFANSIATLAFPKFANRSMKEIEGNLWNRLWIFTGLMGVAALVYIVLAPVFFHLFFPQYADAIGYSQLFAISLIFVSNTLPPTLLQAHAANKELYIFNVVVPIFQIGILVAFTILFGLLGTIWARIVGRGFALALGAYLIRSNARG